MNERRKTKKEIRAEYEKQWTLVMVRWLGRFTDKPRRNGDIFVEVLGEIKVFEKCTYLTEAQTSRLPLLEQPREIAKRDIAKHFPPTGPAWNPFNDFAPWIGPRGLLKKIRTTDLLDVFLIKLDLSNQLNSIEELFGWLENNPTISAKLMAEALVEILEEKGIKP